MKSHWFSLVAGVILPGGLCLAQSAGMGGSGGFGGSGGMRGLGATVPREGMQMSPKARWRPWLRVSGYYNDQLTYLNNEGEVSNAYDTKGAYANWGLACSKLVEDTSIVGVYSGSAILSSNQSQLNGTSHMFQLGAGHKFNRRVYAEVQQILGSGYGGFGFGSSFAGMGASAVGSMQTGWLAPGSVYGFGDPSINGFVDQEAFSNRVSFSGTVGTLIYRLSLRSTAMASGGAYFTRRKNASLADNNAYAASGGYSYALNRRTEIGAGYGYNTFVYPDVFGGNHIQTLNVQLSRKLGENGGINTRGGVTRFNSSFIGLVPVDPDIAGILGISAVTAVREAKRTTFSGDLFAYYNSKMLNVSFVANRSAVPGNGIMYGAMRDLIFLTLSRTIVENRLFGGLSGGAARNSGFLQSDVQRMTQTSASLSLTIYKGLALTASGGLRWQQFNKAGPTLPSRFATVGLGWSPGDLPFLF